VDDGDWSCRSDGVLASMQTRQLVVVYKHA
jgi:hypothetical protein